jgi:hypothetical protein
MTFDGLLYAETYDREPRMDHWMWLRSHSERLLATFGSLMVVAYQFRIRLGIVDRSLMRGYLC